MVEAFKLPVAEGAAEGCTSRGKQPCSGCRPETTRVMLDSVDRDSDINLRPQLQMMPLAVIGDDRLSLQCR